MSSTFGDVEPSAAAEAGAFVIEDEEETQGSFEFPEKEIKMEMETNDGDGADVKAAADGVADGGEDEDEDDESEYTDDEDDDEELAPPMTLSEQAGVVMTIMKPVSLTMLLVVCAVLFLSIPTDRSPNTVWLVYQEHSSDSTGVKLGGALLDAVVFVVMMVVATFVLVLCFKYRCMKFIYGWLILSTAMLLAMFGSFALWFIIQAANVAVDWVTFAVVMWNFAIGGVVCVFWYAPSYLTQIYLILVSALMALFFTQIQEYTTWAILLAVSIYDLFAVLCPRGPLKMLVNLAQERQEPIPALLYNGMLWMTMMKEEETEIEMEEMAKDGGMGAVPLVAHDIAEEEEALGDDVVFIQEEKRHSVKLGLGDFVFYSVLMARAALYDMVTVVACFVAILTGLFLTLLLLAIFRMALPALPISIALGTVFYFTTRMIIVPFVLSIGSESVFV